VVIPLKQSVLEQLNKLVLKDVIRFVKWVTFVPSNVIFVHLANALSLLKKYYLDVNISKKWHVLLTLSLLNVS
jgi:hypothetical protein